MFIQVVQGRTTDGPALRQQLDRWEQDMRPGAKGYLGSTGGVADDGTAIFLARFEDEESARANSDRPEQGSWWNETARHFDGDVTFRDCADADLSLGGGSDDAGFVQVMKFTGVDRSRMEEMDAAFEPFAAQRPDLLGGFRIWTGADSCFDVAYFTSEAEARKGEQAEMPEELQKVMAEFQDVREPEYFDLTEPQLH